MTTTLYNLFSAAPRRRTLTEEVVMNRQRYAVYLILALTFIYHLSGG